MYTDGETEAAGLNSPPHLGKISTIRIKEAEERIFNPGDNRKNTSMFFPKDVHVSGKRRTCFFDSSAI